MKRKYWRIGLLVLLLVNECADTEHKNTQKEEIYFLYATPLADHPIWLKSKEGFDQACKELDVKCDWIGPSVIDTEKMEEVITQGMYQKADGIITQGVVSADLLNEVAQQDIPVVLVDSNVENAEKFMYYGKNFHTQAQLFLKEIEHTVGKNENLIVAIQVAELDFKIAQDQIKEIEKVFQAHPGGVEIITITESKSDKVRAQSEWVRAFREHPDINVSINFAAESAEACGEVVQTLDIRDQVHIYGVDDMDTTLNYIRSGKIDASIVTSFYQYGYKSVYQMYDYVTKGTAAKQDDQIKLMIVNKDNVDSYKEDLK